MRGAAHLCYIPGSMKRAIHQLVAGFSYGDAISNEALVLRGIFRSWGFDSDIFCEARRILPELRGEARDVAGAKESFRPDDIAFLHLSIGSPVNDLFAELPCHKALLYHNITPPDYFRGIQEQIAHHLAKGREQAKRLAGAASVVLADSRFNADELESWGYGPAGVLPLVLDLARLRGEADRGVLKKYDDGLVNVLFVGRCVPNKRLEDGLAAFHYFQRYVEPASRFIHAGSFAGVEQYHALLLTMMRDLRLQNVELIGSVRQDELNACYKSARLFLCMSEHEGFCIPLIESLVHDVPVLAYAAAAVPGTLDGAGVLFREKRFDLVAEMMGRLVRDASLRGAVLKGQRERLARYEQRDLAAELRNHLASLLAG
ncbi:MAG TPA: glycosyltransferase family 4 protein [Kiritimatiellia bacterium]|nr:glycosyltransferase family 4 protein [Kiritimatiellia bacterium]